MLVGGAVGTLDGLKLGFAVGDEDGEPLGILESLRVGTVEGNTEDSSDGFDVGEVLGVVVG